MLSKLLDYWKILLGALVACVLSFFAGRVTSPKLPPKSVERTQEIQVDKTVEVQKDSTQVVKVTRTQKKPDGTVNTEVIESQTQTAETTREKVKEVVKEKVVVKNTQYEYSLGVGASIDLTKGFRELQPMYHIIGGKRIVGGWWAEIEYGAKPDFKSQEAKISVKMEF